MFAAAVGFTFLLRICIDAERNQEDRDSYDSTEAARVTRRPKTATSVPGRRLKKAGRPLYLEDADHVLNETSSVDAGRGFFLPNSLTKLTSHFLRNRHRLERARVAFLAGPNAGLGTFGRDLPRRVPKDMRDGE